jgi:hypothetical protein
VVKYTVPGTEWLDMKLFGFLAGYMNLHSLSSCILASRKDIDLDSECESIYPAMIPSINKYICPNAE